MADSEPLLRSLGISFKSNFDWGDQPQAKTRSTEISTNAKQSSSAHGNLPLSSWSTSSSALSVTSPSGLESLTKFIQHKGGGAGEGRNTTKNDKVRNIIRSLLKDAGARVFESAEDNGDGVDDDGDALKQKQHQLEKNNSKHKKRYQKLLLLQGDQQLRDVPIQGLSDRAVAELTVESKSSLFGSILRVFDMHRYNNKQNENKLEKLEEGNASVEEKYGEEMDDMIIKTPILTTAEIVRTVHLTARPGDIPPGMDSKEYTMAALHFLSSHVPFLSENNHEELSQLEQDSSSSHEGWDLLRKTLPILPLLKAINPNEGIERRSYGRVRPLVSLGQAERKEIPDSMDLDMDFRRKVMNLERIFASSLPFSSYSTSFAQPLVASSSPSSLPSKEGDTNKHIPYAFQKYVPRRKLCPHVDGGAKEELTLMISGHFQQHVSTPASRTATPFTLKAASASTKSTGASKRTSTDSKSHTLKPSSLKIKIGASKSNSDKKESRGKHSASSGTSPKRKSGEEDHSKSHLPKKKRIINDAEEFGF